jgi:hypothetical protein
VDSETDGAGLATKRSKVRLKLPAQAKLKSTPHSTAAHKSKHQVQRRGGDRRGGRGTKRRGRRLRSREGVVSS